MLFLRIKKMLLRIIALEGRGFFADYNDTGTSITPVNLSAGVWTPVPNNGAGGFTNTAYLPEDVTDLLDVSTGAFDFSELSLGATCLIRNDFTVTPTVNDCALSLRYSLGSGVNAYTLEGPLARLDEGAGVGYRRALKPDMIYMGDTNTRDNPVTLEIKCSVDATLVNAGSAITVTSNS